jgi:hypothetical protein
MIVLIHLSETFRIPSQKKTFRIPSTKEMICPNKLRLVSVIVLRNFIVNNIQPTPKIPVIRRKKAQGVLELD